LQGFLVLISAAMTEFSLFWPLLQQGKADAPSKSHANWLASANR
jgi:hypothetical protein